MPLYLGPLRIGLLLPDPYLGPLRIGLLCFAALLHLSPVLGKLPPPRDRCKLSQYGRKVEQSIEGAKPDPLGAKIRTRYSPFHW